MNKLLIVFISILLLSCTNKKKSTGELEKVPFDELIELLRNNQVNLFQVLYKDSVGNDLSDTLRAQLNRGELYREFYRNSSAGISQIRVRKLQEKEIFLEIQIRELLSDPFKNIPKVEVNCTNRDSLLIDAYQKDQDTRKGIDVGIIDVDGENQKLVTSIIDQCGWPDDVKSIKAIWFVIQHSNSGLMAYYYPQFKQFVKMGLLEESTMALMEDRMLMSNGFPQIYGSQIVQNSVYKFRDPPNINKRREAIGLPPIEEYTKRFGFIFKLEDYINE